MKNTILAVLAFLVVDSFGLSKEKTTAEEYRANALEATKCLFAVADNLNKQERPASIEIATSMKVWIDIVSDSLAHKNLDFRIKTEEVVEMRRLKMIETNAVRKEDGLEPINDWFGTLLESVKVVQDDYREKGWARPNLGWLTLFRRLSEVMQAEAHWENVNLNESELRANKYNLKHSMSLLEAVKSVRVQYEGRGHRPGSIGWVEDILGVRVMAWVPSLKKIETKKILVTRILSEKASVSTSKLLKPFRPKKEDLKGKSPAKPPKATPAPAPQREREYTGPTVLVRI